MGIIQGGNCPVENIQVGIIQGGNYQGGTYHVVSTLMNEECFNLLLYVFSSVHISTFLRVLEQGAKMELSGLSYSHLQQNIYRIYLNNTMIFSSNLDIQV